MKTKAPSLLLSFFLLISCGEDSGNDTVALLALLNRKCKSLPQKITRTDVNVSSSDITYNCYTSGLKYVCKGDGMTVTRNYLSIAQANLGVVNPPDFGNFSFNGERGLAYVFIVLQSNPTVKDTYYTLEYDSSHQLASTTNQLSAPPMIVTWGGYDSAGFATTNDLGSTTAQFLYDFGTTIPSKIVSGSYEITFDIKGWPKTASDPSTEYEYKYGGIAEICQ
ncbi:hypothetical protein CH352_02825 [Leptospira hartskeerlii]|uniref:Lipoprotein n=1 Tax=Leptospira hartskeerlii TaxID=2023177 RepID=A0A2M9XD44_9LEPT|nr:hypothetical protein [Leptospira hartskeerlii]PJZ25621.1 hypothetical protein CH357_08155 [Leptospira hartskeerlii]PJZ35556.1 hypothetical protein CH352_02825 [Leptospira hartskeerlii]